jgi:uncharacterized protein (DUF1800 family)
MSDRLSSEGRRVWRALMESPLQCPAPADFRNASLQAQTPTPVAATLSPAARSEPIADAVDERPQPSARAVRPTQAQIRRTLELRHNGGRPLRFEAATSRPAVSNAITPLLASDAGPAPDGPAPAQVPSTGGMSRPQLVALPRPSLAIRTLNNLAFGATPAEIGAFNALGTSDTARLTAWVDKQLNWSAIDDSAVETRLTNAGYTTLGKSLTQLWADHVVPDPDYQVRMRPAWEIQRAALVRAVYSKRQLREVMTMFWHDHFNVMCTDYSAGPVFVSYDRDVIRQNVFGNFRTLLEAVAKSTAMLYFLDNQSNTRAGPNENFARELMELHSFGAENYLGFMDPFQVPPCPEDPTYPIGYTDIDVYETASAFTGWSLKNAPWEFPTENDGTFAYRPSWHDAGPKYPLGMFLYPEQAALKDGHDILDRIASHPRVAKFICKKLIRRFFADNPSQASIDSAAAVFRANWQNPDQIKLTLRHILLSDDAYSDWGQKMRRPFEAMAAAMRALGTDWTLRLDEDKSDEFMWRFGFTGHQAYDWPAPNGYPDTMLAWSGSNSFGMTWKVLNWFTETQNGTTPLAPILALTRAGVPQWTSTALVDFWCNRLLGYLPARRQIYVDFMRQNGAASDVIADTDAWAQNDLKKHYNQQRLRSMVSLILMSPEFLAR